MIWESAASSPIQGAIMGFGLLYVANEVLFEQFMEGKIFKNKKKIEQTTPRTTGENDETIRGKGTKEDDSVLPR